MKENTPTSKFYGLLQFLFDYYNEHLFESMINDCMIVITRKKNVAGYYIPKRWLDSKKGIESVDELALNPTMFHKYPMTEICQTIVHEMVHAWQQTYGKPSRRGYHNKEWASKMISIGLIPTDTGKPGGKQTGFFMSDYPEKDGKFLKETEILINSEVFKDLYFDINPQLLKLIDESKPLHEQLTNLVIEEAPNQEKPKSKVKYSCSCANVWGKPDLNLKCNTCGEDFKMN